MARCAGNRKLLRKLYDHSVETLNFHLSAVILSLVGDGYEKSPDLDIVTRALAPALEPRTDFFGPLDSRCFEMGREISRCVITSEDLREAEMFFSTGFGFVSVFAVWNCWIDYRLEKPEPKMVVFATERQVYVVSANACKPLLKMILTSQQWTKVFEKKDRKAILYVLRRWIGMPFSFEPLLFVDVVSDIQGLRICTAEAGSVWPDSVTDLSLTQIHYLSVAAWKVLSGVGKCKVLLSSGYDGKESVWGSFDKV